MACKEQRATQCCRLCKIHNKIQQKKNHKCDFAKPDHINECNDCKNLKELQKIVADKKAREYQCNKRQGSINKNISKVKIRGSQMCKKCSNHKETSRLIEKHLVKCPYRECPCDDCKETDKGRKLQKVQIKRERKFCLDRDLKPEQYDCMDSSTSSPEPLKNHMMPLKPKLVSRETEKTEEDFVDSTIEAKDLTNKVQQSVKDRSTSSPEEQESGYLSCMDIEQTSIDDPLFPDPEESIEDIYQGYNSRDSIEKTLFIRGDPAMEYLLTDEQRDELMGYLNENNSGIEGDLDQVYLDFMSTN